MKAELFKELFVTCNQGLEPALVAELQAMGFKSINMSRRGVYIRDLKDKDELLQSIYKVNYLSRVGLRVLHPIIKFKPKSKEDFYQFCKRHVKWGKFISPETTFAIDSYIDPKSKIFSNSHYAAQVMKDAIVDQMRDQFGDRSTIDREYPDVQFNLVMSAADENFATISYDTSGNPLNMRQYRVKTGLDATLRETLAAGIVKMGLEGLQGKPVVYDPCAGSSTLLIEAAMQLTNTPSGFLRKDWGFMKLPFFNQGMWEEFRDKENKKKIPLAGATIFGTDIHPKAIESSAANFHRLGMEVSYRFVNKENTVVIQQKDFQKFEPEVLPNLVVSNLPYGERLSNAEELKSLYKEIGRFLKNKVQKPGKALLLMTDSELLKEVRLQRTRKIQLKNGGLSSFLVFYDLFNKEVSE